MRIEILGSGYWEKICLILDNSRRPDRVDSQL